MTSLQATVAAIQEKPFDKYALTTWITAELMLIQARLRWNSRGYTASLPATVQTLECPHCAAAARVI